MAGTRKRIELTTDPLKLLLDAGEIAGSRPFRRHLLHVCRRRLDIGGLKTCATKILKSSIDRRDSPLDFARLQPAGCDHLVQAPLEPRDCIRDLCWSAFLMQRQRVVIPLSKPVELPAQPVKTMVDRGQTLPVVSVEAQG